MDVILNGLGKWKGRNLLAGLSVIPGEWDALLPWPCTLKADIILRKQSGDSVSIPSNANINSILLMFCFLIVRYHH